MTAARKEVLAEALAEARHRASEYRRWWAGQEADSEPPWSAADEAAVARLEPVDPWWSRSVADELDRVRALVLEAGDALTGLAAGDGPVAGVCARLAASAGERAGELSALAGAVRDTGERAAEALEHAACRLLAAGRDTAGSDEGWFRRHGELLRGLRDGLSGAAAIWCDGETGCPDPPGRWLPGEPSGGWSPGEPSGGRLPGEPPGRWLPGEPARVVDLAPPSLPSRPAAAGVEPGTGVLLPDTGGRRPGPERGVRVAWLPESPSRPGG